MPKQVGGDRYEVTLVFLPDHPLATKEELKVSSPLLNIPAVLVAEHLNSTNNNPSNNSANDSIVSKTQEIYENGTERATEESTKVDQIRENHDINNETKQEINAEIADNGKEREEELNLHVPKENNQGELTVPTKPEPLIIPPLALPAKEDSKNRRPASVTVSEKVLDSNQKLSSSSLLDDSVILTKSNLDTSLDTSVLESSVALDTSNAPASSVTEGATSEKKQSRTKSSRRRREKSSDKTSDKKSSYHLITFIDGHAY